MVYHISLLAVCDDSYLFFEVVLQFIYPVAKSTQFTPTLTATILRGDPLQLALLSLFLLWDLHTAPSSVGEVRLEKWSMYIG